MDASKETNNSFYTFNLKTNSPSKTHFESMSRLGNGGMGTVYKVKELNATFDIIFKKIIKDGAEVGMYREIGNVNYLNLQPDHEWLNRHSNRNADGVDGIPPAPFAMIYKSERREQLLGYTARLENGDMEHPLPEGFQLIQGFRQLLTGLAYCHHKQITHSDIKPENIFHRGLDTALLADFGMSEIYDEEGDEVFILPFGASHMFSLSDQAAMQKLKETKQRPEAFKLRCAIDVRQMGITMSKIAGANTALIAEWNPTQKAAFNTLLIKMGVTAPDAADQNHKERITAEEALAEFDEIISFASPSVKAAPTKELAKQSMRRKRARTDSVCQGQFEQLKRAAHELPFHTTRSGASWKWIG